MSLLDAHLQVDRTSVLMGIEQEMSAVLVERHGVPQSKAETTARHFAERLAAIFAGETLTIPTDYSYRAARTAQKVIAEFNGRNHRELCKKFKIRFSTIYDILSGRKSNRGRQLVLLGQLPPRAPFMLSVVEVVSFYLQQDLGQSRELAEEIGNEVADLVAEEYGGFMVWFPAGYSLKEARRDVGVLLDFDGTNHEALAEQHGLPLDDVHEILGRYRNLPLRAPA